MTRCKRRDFLTAITALPSLGFAGVTSAQSSRTVEMRTKNGEYLFDPIGLHVQPGETVTFKNVSGSHSATAYKKGLGPSQTTRIPDGAKGWNSGTLTSKGATFEHTFNTEGTYDYYCIPHKTLGMVGRIVVGEPGGPAEGSMPPDGKVPKSGKIVEQGAVPYSEFTPEGASSGGSASGDGSVSNSANGGSNGGSSGTEFTISKPIQGGGLLGGMAIIAGLAYRYLNSEGERVRVGSAEWKHQRGGK